MQRPETHFNLSVRHQVVGALTLWMLLAGGSACSTWRDSRSDLRPVATIADARFPHGYSTARDWRKSGPKDETYPGWQKFTPEGVIYRPDVTVARELYGRLTPDFGVGTILVKEEYRTMGKSPPRMTVIGIMRRTDDPQHTRTNGWSFEAYDPKTMHRLEEETATCIGCHALQKDSDWRFAIGHSISP